MKRKIFILFYINYIHVSKDLLHSLHLVVVDLVSKICCLTLVTMYEINQSQRQILT